MTEDQAKLRGQSYPIQDGYDKLCSECKHYWCGNDGYAYIEFCKILMGDASDCEKEDRIYFEARSKEERT